MPYPTLHLQLLAAPSTIESEQEQSIGGQPLSTIKVNSSSPTPMECSFEDAVARLGKCERLYVELDGSFVWTGGQDVSGEPSVEAWQLDGMVYDRDGKVLWCELKGTCPLSRWLELLACFGASEQSLVAYVEREKAHVHVTEMRKLWDSKVAGE